MRKSIYIVFVLAITACHSLPKEKFHQYSFHPSVDYEGDTLQIRLPNPLQCPLRIYLRSDAEILGDALEIASPVLLEPMQDSLLNVILEDSIKGRINFTPRFGDIDRELGETGFEYPFPRGMSYKIIQGNNTNHTHNTDWSRYALDFNLAVGDTICAADSGYVVGVIEDYSKGGEGNQWKPYGNFITLFHPHNGYFTQYVHLDFKGSMVELGDWVDAGESIGISGMTGQTNIAHLHFNCLKPVDNDQGLMSSPYSFKDGRSSENFKAGDLVKRE